MPEAPHSNTGQQLADDLRRIREDRNVSLDALHDETKIPVGLLQQFEDTGLFDHPMFNRVYLRSLIRAYAEMVEIPTNTALAALDQALDGSYDGLLVSEYLEGAPERSTPQDVEEKTDQEAVEEEAESVAKQTEQERDETEKAAASKATVSSAAVSKAVEKGSEQTATSPQVQEEADQPPTPKTTERAITQRRQPAARSSKRSTSGQRRSEIKLGGINPAFVFGGIGVLVLGGIIWAIITFVDFGSSADEVQQAQAVADSVARADSLASAQAQADAEAERQPQRANITLGDTLNFVIIADQDKVQGIRITRDDDVRRPYWIEQGVAQAFPAQRRIIIDDKLDIIRVLLNGYPYPTTNRDDRGRLVITRDSAQAFVDTLTGQPEQVDIAEVNPVFNE